MSSGRTHGGIWKGAAAWLLSLVLCLGSVGDLLANSSPLQGPFGIAGEICHSPRPGEKRTGETEPRAAHDCCVACHAAQDQQLVPPPVVLVRPTRPSTDVIFTPPVAATPTNLPSRHKNARAPPRA